jgi:16S rRNA processing protein RimM
VTRSRWHSGRLLVWFEGIADRTAAETLRGALLTVDSSTSPAPDSDEFWDHDLVGLDVVSVGGDTLGVVDDVAHPPGAPLLVVRRPDGTETFVPFATEIVPIVDLPGRRVVVAPPEGLFEL